MSDRLASLFGFNVRFHPTTSTHSSALCRYNVSVQATHPELNPGAVDFVVVRTKLYEINTCDKPQTLAVFARECRNCPDTKTRKHTHIKNALTLTHSLTHSLTH